MSSPDKTPFQSVIDALLDNAKILNPAFLYRLSNLDSGERKLLKDNWEKIAVERRRALMADLERLSDTDPLLDFVETCYISIKDIDPEVRLYAVQTMWQEQSRTHAKLLMEIAENDDEIDVRAAAISSLGNYVYYGEIEEIPQDLYRQIERLLLDILNHDEHPLVHRKALESLGYSGSADISKQIIQALQTDDDDWITTALISLGRSANPDWGDTVVKFFDHSAPLIREEAARAAGELELKDAVPLLLDMLDDEDLDVRFAVIWALSSIGGKGVQEALETLMERSGNEDEISLIEEALDNLSFYDGLEEFDLFNFDEDDLYNQDVEIDEGDL